MAKYGISAYVYFRCTVHFILPHNSWIHKFDHQVLRNFALGYSSPAIFTQIRSYEISWISNSNYEDMHSIMLHSNIVRNVLQSEHLYCFSVKFVWVISCQTPRYVRVGKTDRAECCFIQSPLLVTGRYLSGFHYDKTLDRVRLKNSYELVNRRSLRFSRWYKNRIFKGMAKIFCVEFQKRLSKFHTKYPLHWRICSLFRSDHFKSSKIYELQSHDDVIKWKHFPRYWPFVQGIHRSPVTRSFDVSLICAWMNGWLNTREAGD